jgi:hypothetical protein
MTRVAEWACRGLAREAGGGGGRGVGVGVGGGGGASVFGGGIGERQGLGLVLGAIRAHRTRSPRVVECGFQALTQVRQRGLRDLGRT